MEDSQEIEVTLDPVRSDTLSKTLDPFAVEGDKFFKLYSGSMDKNAVRRAKYAASKYEAGDGGAESKQLRHTVSAYDILQATIPPHDQSYLAQLYDKSSWNYAAINAKTANVVGLGYGLEPSPSLKLRLEETEGKRAQKSARKRADAKKNDLYDWIDSLNNSYTFLQTLSKVYIDYQATGNGYIEIGRISSGPNKNRIGYIGHIPSSSVRVRRFHDGFVQMVEGRVRFFRNYQDLKTQDPLGLDPNPNEIIHFKNYSPTNTYYGVPDIIAALNAVAGDEFAQRFNLDLFEHRAAPRYLIVSKGANLSSAAQKEVLEFLQSGLKGKNHRSVYIPLPSDRDGVKSDIEFKPVETNIQDSSFDNYRKSNRDEILAVHRVPPSKIGIMDSVGVAGSIDQDRGFKEIVCRPEQQAIEKKVNAILNEVTEDFRFKLRELTLTDSLSQATIHEKYIRNQILVPNEAREEIGYGPIDGGDTVVELKAQTKADAAANTGKTRERDIARENNASAGGQSARSPKGQGSKPE